MQGADYICPTSIGSLLQFADPAMGGKRIFSGGNERVPVRLNSKMKYGLEFGAAPARFGGVLEILNENKKPITVYLTIMWEWLPNTTPGYKPAEMLWIDVTSCGRQSDFPGKPGTFSLESKDFVMKEDLFMLDAIGMFCFSTSVLC
jgi:hypothetical protein